MVYRVTKIDSTKTNTYPTCGLNVGSEIFVRGRVPSANANFAVNLQGDTEGSDIMLHFNPRTNVKKVIRNSSQGKKWQNEETDTPSFAFTNGSEFTIRMTIGAETIPILVNGKFFVTFKHRLPYQNIRYVTLTQGAEWYELIIKNKCRVPYTLEIPGGLSVGQAVRVRGALLDVASRFFINFNTDREGGTVGLQFKCLLDERDVVLNSKVGGWQNEERGQEWFPFEKGQCYDLLFVILDECFSIYVNGRFFTSYKFRVSLEDIRYLHIDDGIALMDVDLEDPLPKDYIKPVPSGLQVGDVIVVRGFYYPEGDQFAINLLYNISVRNDIALHFNPRRKEDRLVLNNCEKGKWGAEETCELPSALLGLVPFEVEIFNAGTEFRIYVNGNLVATHAARGVNENIKGIYANGDAYFYEVRLLRKAELRFVDKLSGHFSPGSWLCVRGIPQKGISRFAINIQCGDSPPPPTGCDVAFHFNPRFYDQEVVRNIMRNDTWEEEEREQPNFPFKPDEKFKICILKLRDCYRVFVNGQRFVDYRDRMDVGLVSHVALENDQCDMYEPEYY